MNISKIKLGKYREKLDSWNLCVSKKKNKKRTRAKGSYGTCDEIGRATSSYGMSSSKILRINRLL